MRKKPDDAKVRTTQEALEACLVGCIEAAAKALEAEAKRLIGEAQKLREVT